MFQQRNLIEKEKEHLESQARTVINSNVASIRNKMEKKLNDHMKGSKAKIVEQRNQIEQQKAALEEYKKSMELQQSWWEKMKNDLNERVSRQEAAMNQLVMERDAIKNELQGEVAGLKKAVDDSNGENLRLQQKLEVLQSEMEKDIEEGNEVIRSM